MADETPAVAETVEVAAPAPAAPAPAPVAAPVPAPAPAAKRRYKAPAHTSDITFSTGRVVAVDDDGTLAAPDDLGATELDQLGATGFTLITSD